MTTEGDARGIALYWARVMVVLLEIFGFGSTLLAKYLATVYEDSSNLFAFLAHESDRNDRNAILAHQQGRHACPRCRSSEARDEENASQVNARIVCSQGKVLRRSKLWEFCSLVQGTGVLCMRYGTI